jgi:hypothetical protein
VEGSRLRNSAEVAVPRFVGRDRELRRTADALGRFPALVLVQGEAGIGKSRLIAARHGYQVVRAAALAAVEDADEPPRAAVMIVCRWGRRFPAAGVSVCRWGHPATRSPHVDPKIRPACCAWWR